MGMTVKHGLTSAVGSRLVRPSGGELSLHSNNPSFTVGSPKQKRVTFIELQAVEKLSDVLLRCEAVVASAKPHTTKSIQAAQRCPRRQT